MIDVDRHGTPLMGMILHAERVPEEALTFLPTS